ncbi:MAG: prepilin-type N-terminal cleavage/methylation domain-containing protein [Candidatus Moranbacteria bacterium]|nr:prepilin-type N-terminal cleavage/methylation domain-containing protein [Candidatus Moranbacteria bacterium]
MKQKKQKGFTLIEMMIVVAIIGLLATIVIVVVAGARKKANATTAKAHMAQISKALDLYVANGCDTTQLVHLQYGISIKGDTTCGGEVFMQKIPSPPAGSIKYYKCDADTRLKGGPFNATTERKVNAAHYCIMAEGFEEGAFKCVNGSCFCTEPGQTGCVESK